jgi:hypothetical protein
MTPTVSCAVPTLYLASTSNDACNQINGQFLTNISHTDSFVCPYCSWTTLNSTEIPFLTNGTYYVSDGINVRSWTKTSTPSVLYNPSACSSCPVTPTPTQTNTATPTTTCACYSFTNTTETTGEVYYTSCLGNSPTTSSVNAGLTITFCAVYGQPVTSTPGTTGGLCAGFVQTCTDDSNCSACGSNTPTPTPTSTTTPTTTPTPTPTSTPTGGSIATFDGDFILCVQAGATLDFRAQDGSATSGHFTTTAYITAGNCSGPVNVTGTLTSAQGPFKISVPAITSPSTNTAVIVAQAIGATNATVTTAVESGVLKIIITPNSYPSTVTLSGTLTVTFP